jgi:hypothetical protein
MVKRQFYPELICIYQPTTIKTKVKFISYRYLIIKIGLAINIIKSSIVYNIMLKRLYYITDFLNVVYKLSSNSKSQ